MSPVIDVVELPAVAVTVAVWVIETGPIVAETVFAPTVADESVPVATPLPFVGPAGWVKVLPSVGVTASTTAAPPIGLPFASSAVTVMVDPPVPTVIDVGEATTVDCDADTSPAVTVTVAVWVMGVPLIVAEIVLSPAAVELSVPVATPLAFVVPTGCVSVFPVVGVAARTTVAPSIGLPFASLAVTVIVEAPVPAVIGDVAATVDCAAETSPAVPVAVKVTGLPVMPLPEAVAVSLFGPAVGLKVQLPTTATPLPFVI